MFKNLKLLRQHELTHLPCPRYQCNVRSSFSWIKHFLSTFLFQVCGMKFDQRSSWNKHWSGAHAKTHSLVELMELPVLNHDGPFICDFCGKIYASRSALRKHLIKFHRKAQMYCDLCPKSFNILFQLEQHLLVFHLNMTNDCDVCGFKAAHRKMLLKHKRKHGPKTECQICHKLVRDIKNHQKTHLTVTCKICRKKIDGNLMKNHVKLCLNKSGVQRTFLCDLCPNSYHLKSHLWIHIQKTHLKIKLYACDVCGFESAHKSALKLHKKKHDPKVKCPICEKLVNNVKSHKRNVHPAKDQFYVCDVCGYKSAHKSGLKLHKKIHDPKVKCPICDKLVTNIKKHGFTVHPIKNKLLVCDVCGFLAAYKSLLEKHKKIHEPKVKCPICNKLVRYIKRHKHEVHPVILAVR